MPIHEMQSSDIIEIDNLSELVAIDKSYSKYLTGITRENGGKTNE